MNPIAALEPLDRLRASSVDPAHTTILDELRARMVGELVGDLTMITRSLHPQFVLFTDDRTVDRESFVASMKAFVASDAVMWMEWESLTIVRDTIEGCGQLFRTTSSDVHQPGGEPGIRARMCDVLLRFEGPFFVEEQVITRTNETIVDTPSKGIPQRSDLRMLLSS